MTPGLHYDDARHFYSLNGTPLVSVTTVLREMGVVSFDGIPEDVLEFARQRGAALHYALRLINEGTLNRATVDPRILPQCEAYGEFLVQTQFRVAGFEQPLAHARLGFAGTPDLWGDLACRGMVLDVKATDGPILLGYGCQLSAYKLLLVENGYAVQDRAILQLTSDGKWKLHPMRDHGDEHEFKSALYLFQRRKAREKGHGNG